MTLGARLKGGGSTEGVFVPKSQGRPQAEPSWSGRASRPGKNPQSTGEREPRELWGGADPTPWGSVADRSGR